MSEDGALSPSQLRVLGYLHELGPFPGAWIETKHRDADTIAICRKLAERGYAKPERARFRGQPRARYHITEAGKRALQAVTE